MTLPEAMAVVARVQQALVAAGYDIGQWGPCGDGVDGRWGKDSRSGWAKAMADAGLDPTQTTELLARLGIDDIDGMQLQTAVTTWNQWRRTQDIGSPEYEAAANLALAEGTGITQQTCPQAQLVQPGYVPTPDLYHQQPPTQKPGVPWWVWLLVGLAVAGAAGGGIWYYTQYRKRRRKKKSLNGYGDNDQPSAGSEITEDELGGSYTGEITWGMEPDPSQEVSVDDDDEYE